MLYQNLFLPNLLIINTKNLAKNQTSIWKSEKLFVYLHSNKEI